MRVVSLLPSATETLVSIGGSSLLVGRSHECDEPSDIKNLPAVTFPRARSADHTATDGRTRGRIDAGASPDGLDLDRLRALNPDLILTRDRCGVCSISAGELREALRGWPGRPEVLAVNATSIEGMFDAALTIGSACELDGPARDAVTRWRDRQHTAMDLVTPYVTGPRVAVLEWTDPLRIAGSWVPQLVERAGAVYPLCATTAAAGSGSGAGAHMAHRTAPPSREITPGELLAADLDVVVVAPCGEPLGAAVRALGVLRTAPWWKDLGARAAAVSGTLLGRPGPRLIDAQEWFVAWLGDREPPASFPWSAGDGPADRAND